MSERVRNYIGAAVIFALIVGAFSFWSFVRSYSKSIEPSAFRSFSVSGEGEAVAIPDVAKFSFSVLTEGGTDIATLQRENTEKVNKAIAFVKSKGVDSKDIKTRNYNLSPRYQYYSCSPVEYSVRPCPPAQIVGYSITQNVEVKIRDFSVIGDALAGVVQNGANTVSQLSFEIDDPTKLQDEAREEAIRKAKEKAKAIAKAGGFRLGRLLSIDEGGGYIPVYRYSALESTAYGGGTDKVPLPAPTIEPGSQEVKIIATLRYEIE